MDQAEMTMSQQERFLLSQQLRDQSNNHNLNNSTNDSAVSHLTVENFNNNNNGTINSFNDSYQEKSFNNLSLNNQLSEIESAILKSSVPIDLNEETEEIIVNGQKGIWINKNEIIKWKGSLPLSQYPINDDPSPEIINKKPNQDLIYHQEVAIRYLRPPTPPSPEPILIQQEPNIVTPPAPPLIIRQQPARPATPPPLVIREAPPPPPPVVGKRVITIPGKRIPPPPRKVIIERLAPLPSKPQSIIIERWLPYRQIKRKVIFAKSNNNDNKELSYASNKPKNVIVQWQAPQVKIEKEFKDLGVVKTNPMEYVQRYGSSLKNCIELPKFVQEIKPPSGLSLAAESTTNTSGLYELEGDVHALNLLDLEREGLIEYKYLLKNLNSPLNKQLEANYQNYDYNNINLINDIFRSLNLETENTVSINEAERILSRFYSKLGRRFGENELRSFFRSVDLDSNGRIDVRDIKRVFESLI